MPPSDVKARSLEIAKGAMAPIRTFIALAAAKTGGFDVHNRNFGATRVLANGQVDVVPRFGYEKHRVALDSFSAEWLGGAAECASIALAKLEAQSPAAPASDLEEIVSRHVNNYLFPGEICHTPDVDSMEYADRMASALRRRLPELQAKGLNVSTMTINELLEGIDLDK